MLTRVPIVISRGSGKRSTVGWLDAAHAYAFPPRSSLALGPLPRTADQTASTVTESFRT